MNSHKNFKELIGSFEDKKEEQIFKLIEKKFELKRKYSERDWLTQNRNEVPQSYPVYERTQLQNHRSKMPRIKKVKIVQLWTE